MARVKFKFSVEKITFEFEGDQDTGIAVNRAMNHTLGSLVEAQNHVIDITPEPPTPALPPVASPPRRKHRSKPKAVANGQPPAEVAPTDGAPVAPKPIRQRRAPGSSFRDQMYPLIHAGYLDMPRTASEIHAELARQGHHFNPKNVASELLWFTKKHYLSRDHNQDGKYAYVKGTNNDFPGGQGGS